MNVVEWKKRIADGKLEQTFRLLYGNEPVELEKQRKRYIDALNAFSELYPKHQEVFLFSAPGRTEIGGNHTDHQHGCVLAAAVNLDVIAVVAFHNEKIIRLKSKGYPEDFVDLNDLKAHTEEFGTSKALIRGIAAKFSDMGVLVSGFDAYTTSEVLSGSGLSSSAAFEVLVGTIIDIHDNHGNAGAIEIAKIGQYAENVYFGKKSGLMDQMVSSVGGFVWIDFIDIEHPKIHKQNFDFAEAGYCLCITDTKGSHADLTPDYIAVPTEMKEIAAALGKDVLREVDETAFYDAIPKLKERCSDRAILRAAHFFGENRRATQEAAALEDGRVEDFFHLVRASGDSSANLLQNLYSCANPHEQGIPLGILMSKRILQDKGAVRVHGGGFAGTIQAFVPMEYISQYAEEMNRLYGEGSCYILRIRSVGGIAVTAESE